MKILSWKLLRYKFKVGLDGELTSWNASNTYIEFLDVKLVLVIGPILQHKEDWLESIPVKYETIS